MQFIKLYSSVAYCAELVFQFRFFALCQIICHSYSFERPSSSDQYLRGSWLTHWENQLGTYIYSCESVPHAKIRTHFKSALRCLSDFLFSFSVTPNLVPRVSHLLALAPGWQEDEKTWNRPSIVLHPVKLQAAILRPSVRELL